MAQAEKIELPEPVHLNLAQADVEAGDLEGARKVLEEYLEREPTGEWRARTQAMLAGRFRREERFRRGPTWRALPDGMGRAGFREYPPAPTMCARNGPRPPSFPGSSRRNPPCRAGVCSSSHLSL